MENIENEGLPSYEEACRTQFTNGMCTSQCNRHATNSLSEFMRRCPVSVLKVAMCKIMYECLEVCTDEEKIDISDAYVTCIGNVDVPKRSLSSQGMARTEIWNKQNIGYELVRVVKNWNQCRIKMYNNILINSNEGMSEQMIVFSDKSLSKLLTISMDLATATDTINNLDTSVFKHKN